MEATTTRDSRVKMISRTFLREIEIHSSRRFARTLDWARSVKIDSVDDSAICIRLETELSLLIRSSFPNTCKKLFCVTASYTSSRSSDNSLNVCPRAHACMENSARIAYRLSPTLFLTRLSLPPFQVDLATKTTVEESSPEPANLDRL